MVTHDGLDSTPSFPDIFLVHAMELNIIVVFENLSHLHI